MPTFNTQRTPCTMTRRIIPYTFSNFDAQVSLIPKITSHLPQQLSITYHLNHLERRGQLRFTQFSRPNLSARFYDLAQRYFSIAAKNSAPLENDKADRLDFFNRISINFNFRLPTPNHRALAHTCCHTAIGG